MSISTLKYFMIIYDVRSAVNLFHGIHTYVCHAVWWCRDSIEREESSTEKEWWNSTSCTHSCIILQTVTAGHCLEMTSLNNTFDIVLLHR